MKPCPICHIANLCCNTEPHFHEVDTQYTILFRIYPFMRTRPAVVSWLGKHNELRNKQKYVCKVCDICFVVL